MRETRSLHDLREEITSLKKSNALKDDTIVFLQREKDTLIKEVRAGEASLFYCSGFSIGSTRW